MAKTKLTPLSKLLITLVVVGAIGFGLHTVSKNPDIKEKIGSIGSSDVPEGYKPVINIGVVTWGGYAGGQYFNNGFEPNSESRFRKEYGFDVSFQVIDDFDASREAFKNGNIDLLWATIDALPTEMEGLEQYDPQVVFQADWSRGGDAVVVRRGIGSVADLKGLKIAVAPMTPSHSFLLWLLEAGDLKLSDVILVEVPSAIDAADAFKSNSVDAAVVWSPDDADCVEKVPGSRVLESTRNASHIIADVFIAKKSFIQANKKQLQELYEGWMIGTSEINTNDVSKQKAAEILAVGLNQPVDFCLDAINNVRLTTHGDNKDFFGINRSYAGVTGSSCITR
jgi:NitT/TauT family transport system substrate-binding protein